HPPTLLPLSLHDTTSTVIYTLSLHDALPIYFASSLGLTPSEHSSGGKQRLGRITKRGNRYLRWLLVQCAMSHLRHLKGQTDALSDRKSTRLNSSHVKISYAVFCLKKKKTYR